MSPQLSDLPGPLTPENAGWLAPIPSGARRKSGQCGRGFYYAAAMGGRLHPPHICSREGEDGKQLAFILGVLLSPPRRLFQALVTPRTSTRLDNQFGEMP